MVVLVYGHHHEVLLEDIHLPSPSLNPVISRGEKQLLLHTTFSLQFYNVMNKKTGFSIICLPSLNWILPSLNRAWFARQTRKPKSSENMNSEIQFDGISYFSPIVKYLFLSSSDNKVNWRYFM